MASDEGTEVLMRAIITLMVDAREARPAEEREARTEVLLARAGLGASAIAELTGKQPAAVRMAISRARRSPKGRGRA